MHIHEDLDDAGFGQSHGLPRDILIAGGDPRVAEKPSHTVPPTDRSLESLGANLSGGRLAVHKICPPNDRHPQS
jgi:hypothetical protein